MLITFCGNVLICDSDAALVLFSQRGASGGLFGMVYEVSSARIGDCFITIKLSAFRGVRGEWLEERRGGVPPRGALSM